MTTLKRIVTAAYETTDGKTFSDKNEAAKHQAGLDRVKKVRGLLGKVGIDVSVPTAICDSIYDSFAAFIVDNADALREILPKRAKSEPAAAPASQTGLVANTPPLPDAAKITMLAKVPLQMPVDLSGMVAQQAATTA